MKNMKSKEPTLTHGSLFAGMGGFDLGFKRAGIKTIWQVEIEDYATRVLENNFPGAKRYRDIRQVRGVPAGGTHPQAAGGHAAGQEAGGILAPVQVISGGFPCVDISNAGKCKGIAEGTRSGLWKEYLRLVGEIRPRYVVVENVAALAHRGLWIVAGDLSKIGYDSEWETFQAADFGLPHKRERIFLVAYPKGFGCGRGRVFGLANADSIRRSSCQEQPAEVGGPAGKDAAGTQGWVLRDFHGRSGRVRQAPESSFASVDDGIPTGMVPDDAAGFRPELHIEECERLKALGNAVVPAVVEHVARCILAFDARQPDPNHKHRPTCAPPPIFIAHAKRQANARN